MKYLLIVFLYAVSLFSQVPQSVTDTIRVTALQEFKVPKEKNILLVAVYDSDLKATLMDEAGSFIREINGIWQLPTKEEITREVKGGRGTTVQYHVNEKIEKAGVYYVKLNFDYVDEYKKKHSNEAFYRIEVSNPTLASAITLRKSGNYNFTEKESFAFMTVEFSDPTAYSYRIEDNLGNVLKESIGPIAVLDDVLDKVENVGKEITIIGLYNSKEFLYTYNGDKEPRTSRWNVKIQRPVLDEFSDWKKSKDDQTIYVSAFNENARRILYTYIGKTEDNGFVLVQPEISNFRFTSDPNNIITNAKAIPSGVFLYVTFDFNQELLSLMNECATQEISFSIEFTDQFGSTIRKEYNAVLLN
jgi:hypothetical protein